MIFFENQHSYVSLCSLQIETDFPRHSLKNWKTYKRCVADPEIGTPSMIDLFAIYGGKFREKVDRSSFVDMEQEENALVKLCQVTKFIGKRFKSFRVVKSSSKARHPFAMNAIQLLIYNQNCHNPSSTSSFSGILAPLRALHKVFIFKMIWLLWTSRIYREAFNMSQVMTDHYHVERLCETS